MLSLSLSPEEVNSSLSPIRKFLQELQWYHLACKDNIWFPSRDQKKQSKITLPNNLRWFCFVLISLLKSYQMLKYTESSSSCVFLNRCFDRFKISYILFAMTDTSVWTYFQLSKFIIFITLWVLTLIFYPSGNSSHEITQTETIAFCCKLV